MLTLDLARAQWLEHLARDRRLAPTSILTYANHLRQTLDGLPSSPTELELRAAIDRRLNHPSGHVRRASFVALSQFFQWWERQGGPSNPLAEAKSPPKPRARRSALTAADPSPRPDRPACRTSPTLPAAPAVGLPQSEARTRAPAGFGSPSLAPLGPAVALPAFGAATVAPGAVAQPASARPGHGRTASWTGWTTSSADGRSSPTSRGLAHSCASR